MWSAPPSWPTLCLWLSIPAVLGWVSLFPSVLTSLSVVLHCSRADFPAGLKTAAQTLRVSFLVSSALFTHTVTEEVDCIFLVYCGVLCCYRKKMAGLRIFANAMECIKLKLPRYVLLLCNKNGSIIQDYLQMPGCACLCVYTYIETKSTMCYAKKGITLTSVWIM